MINKQHRICKWDWHRQWSKYQIIIIHFVSHKAYKLHQHSYVQNHAVTSTGIFRKIAELKIYLQRPFDCTSEDVIERATNRATVLQSRCTEQLLQCCHLPWTHPSWDPQTALSRTGQDDADNLPGAAKKAHWKQSLWLTELSRGREQAVMSTSLCSQMPGIPVLTATLVPQSTFKHNIRPLVQRFQPCHTACFPSPPSLYPEHWC